MLLASKVSVGSFLLETVHNRGPPLTSREPRLAGASSAPSALQTMGLPVSLGLRWNSFRQFSDTSKTAQSFSQRFVHSLSRTPAWSEQYIHTQYRVHGRCLWLVYLHMQDIAVVDYAQYYLYIQFCLCVRSTFYVYVILIKCTQYCVYVRNTDREPVTIIGRKHMHSNI